MKKIDIAIIIFKNSEIASLEDAPLYLSLLDKIKKSMTEKEKEDFDNEVSFFLTKNFLLKIKKIIENYLDIETISIKSKEGLIPYGKQLFCYFAIKKRNQEKSRKKYPLRIIGDIIKVNHTSVVLGKKKLLTLLDVDKNVIHDVNEIEKLINLIL